MAGKIPCEIKYNKAVEFIISISKYSNNKTRQVHWNTPELEKDIAKDIMDLTPNEKVKDWLQNVDNNISPFLRNDLMFVMNDSYKLIDVCLHLVLMEDIENPLSLIQALKLLDTSTMIEITYKFYDLDVSLNDEDNLKLAIIENYSEDTASSFFHYKHNPDQYKKNLIKVLDEFYKEFYQPFEEEVYQFMEERLVFHQQLFKKDPIYFINTIGIGDYSKAINLHNKLVVYMSFFMDIGILYFTYIDILVMCCGQSVEHRFETRKALDTYKSLFKALSDDKRIEILKMTTKRPWYNKELADHFNLSTATLSYHLNLLLDLEILNYEPSIINNRYYYTTNKENLKKLFDIALKDLLD